MTNPEEIDPNDLDREMLRNKYTARSRIFWNEENQSGRRGNRSRLTYKSPNLQIDPSVMYRFAGPEAFRDFQETGLIRGSGQFPSPFFSSSIPLLSYGEQHMSEGSFPYLIATTGENWGERTGVFSSNTNKKELIQSLVKKVKDLNDNNIEIEPPTPVVINNQDIIQATVDRHGILNRIDNRTGENSNDTIDLKPKQEIKRNLNTSKTKYIPGERLLLTIAKDKPELLLSDYKPNINKKNKLKNIIKKIE